MDKNERFEKNQDKMRESFEEQLKEIGQYSPESEDGRDEYVKESFIEEFGKKARDNSSR